jgi:hypothetical protein
MDAPVAHVGLAVAARRESKLIGDANAAASRDRRGLPVAERRTRSPSLPQRTHHLPFAL